jgi:hypothetical protein
MTPSHDKSAPILPGGRAADNPFSRRAAHFMDWSPGRFRQGPPLREFSCNHAKVAKVLVFRSLLDLCTKRRDEALQRCVFSPRSGTFACSHVPMSPPYPPWASDSTNLKRYGLCFSRHPDRRAEGPQWRDRFKQPFHQAPDAESQHSLPWGVNVDRSIGRPTPRHNQISGVATRR